MKTTFKSTLVESLGTKFLTEETAIREWLDKHEIKDYSINGDMTVSVKGNIDLHSKNIDEIPVKFSEVGGAIDVTTNKIKRIDWAPATVNDDFEAWDNEIETLEGGPTVVNGSFDVDGNKLVNLHGGPKKVGGAYIISRNPITSLVGCPVSVGEYFKAADCNISKIDDLPHTIGTSIYLQDNQLTSLKGINKFVKKINANGSPKAGRINISSNPIENGLTAPLAIAGLKSFTYDKGAVNSTQILSVVKIINDALAEGLDPFDIQEKVLDSEFSDLA